MRLRNKKGFGSLTGFTLIEVIIAITISAVVIAILLAAMRLGYRSQEKGIWRDEVSQKMRIINDRVTWLLREHIPMLFPCLKGIFFIFQVNQPAQDLLQPVLIYILRGQRIGQV